jgi:hypothetical protein
VFVSCIAALKLLKADTENEEHLLIARVFFGVFHVFFLLMFLKTKSGITNMMATQDDKLEAGSQLRIVVKGVLLKAAIIGGVHYKLHLIQPLVISSLMGFISLLESHYTYNAVASVLPFLFSTKTLSESKKDN